MYDRIHSRIPREVCCWLKLLSAQGATTISTSFERITTDSPGFKGCRVDFKRRKSKKFTFGVLKKALGGKLILSLVITRVVHKWVSSFCSASQWENESVTLWFPVWVVSLAENQVPSVRLSAWHVVAASWWTIDCCLSFSSVSSAFVKLSFNYGHILLVIALLY